MGTKIRTKFDSRIEIGLVQGRIDIKFFGDTITPLQFRKIRTSLKLNYRKHLRLRRADLRRKESTVSVETPSEPVVETEPSKVDVEYEKAIKEAHGSVENKPVTEESRDKESNDAGRTEKER
jgi:hypothetical protein